VVVVSNDLSLEEFDRVTTTLVAVDVEEQFISMEGIEMER
jgi:hypothetical protein